MRSAQPHSSRATPAPTTPDRPWYREGMEPTELASSGVEVLICRTGRGATESWTTEEEALEAARSHALKTSEPGCTEVGKLFGEDVGHQLTVARETVSLEAEQRDDVVVQQLRDASKRSGLVVAVELVSEEV